MRISTDKKSSLKNAADSPGRTLKDLAIQSAHEAVIKVIQDYQSLHLSVKDSKIFVHTILNLPNPSANLLKATKTYKRNIISK